MKKQLLKLALLGLLSSFGYADGDGDFDIDKDGKIDKIGGEVYYFINNKETPYEKIFNMNADEIIVYPKYRNKRFSEKVEYIINLKGKKYSFFVIRDNKIDSEGFLDNDSMFDTDMVPLRNKKKGFILRITPNGNSYQQTLYVNYENNRFYIKKISSTDSKEGCIVYLSPKIPLPKIINVNNTFYNVYKNKKNKSECINKQDYREKGFDMKLYKRVYGVK